MTDLPISPAIELTARSIAAAHYNRKLHHGVAPKNERIKHLVDQYWKTFVPDAFIVLAALTEYGVIAK